MNVDGQIKLVAATTVAASIAIATANHVARDAKSTTAGVKVARMTAEVADAVANGDANKAAELIFAVAKEVDELAIHSNNVKVSVSNLPHLHVPTPDENQPPSKRAASVLCTIL